VNSCSNAQCTTWLVIPWAASVAELVRMADAVDMGEAYATQL